MKAEEKKRVTEASPQLLVTNFGPIEEARLDLKPLTVFIGPSNTGKSYLAILIYALHRYFGERRGSLSWRFHRLPRLLSQIGPSEASSAVHQALEKVLSQEIIKHEVAEYIDVPEDVISFLRSIFLKAGGADLENEITRCFGLKAAALRRKNGSGPTQISVRVPSVNTQESFEHQLVLGERRTTFSTEIPEKISIPLKSEWLNRMTRRWQSLSEAEGLQASTTYLLDHIAEALHAKIYEPFRRPAHYLPADRTGIMHAHKAVFGAVIGNATMAAIRPSRNMPLLSGILADFLETLIMSDEPIFVRRDAERWREPLRDICTEIEKNIMGGSISTERSEAIEYPEFVYTPTGWEESLPLKSASSMVSELSPVVIYLRHQVTPGDVLIIEEPESHLHPAMQVQFTRQLAAIVNAGVRVIVTTHSEWVLEELANLVRLSSLEKSDRTRIADCGVSLDPAQVGAWLFTAEKPPKGSSIKEIGIDDESGLYPADFGDVAIALHNKWAEITSHLEN